MQTTTAAQFLVYVDMKVHPSY